jgi:ADP-dependent NAD(P)H-hydrate dehydratase / NAD(P)H-hydrate epimerase
MKPVLTPAEMAEADRRTIAAGTPVEALMERAGRAVARAVWRTAGGVYSKHAVVVCGKGNNGGDGLVAARVLRHRGVRVDVFELTGAMDRARFERAARHADVAVDAMYGTGFRGALEGDAAFAALTLAAAPAPVVSVDIPSGVDGLTGAVTGAAVRAERTVCFAALKPGLVFEPGRTHAGVIEVVDIGVDPGEPSVGVVEPADVRRWLPRRAADAHKWAVGGLYVVGGSGGMTGAPLLVSHAALRAGAGIVWCGLPGREAAARASGTEVITRPLPATDDGAIDVDAVPLVLASLDRFRGLVVGPGLGTATGTQEAVRRLVDGANVPLVLDADGLNALQGDVERLRGRMAGTLLTPHEGEYQRLTGRKVGDDRIAAARELAGASASVVLLKGPTTVIATPGGEVALNPTGGPWLATAGTGDVLSGIIGGFVARGASPFAAAAAGAFVHGRAADVAGHTGLIAGDLVDALRRVPELEA